MNKDIVISVEHLSKRYLIGGKQHQWSLRDSIDSFLRHPFGIGDEKHDKQEFWALNDVSFEIKKGDVVGIIGRNGSGKSTLLKILARIVEPTKGKVTMRGRVASLLEVGTGFNPELTGRENIYLNGAILGMSRAEITAKYDEIVAFSGVEKFIDTPVKRYSSGMYVRLAFAVAAHLDSDILLVDEVLAVGDAEFQKKCLGKMDSLAKSGKTVLFVSHDMHAISSLCNKVIYIKDGLFISFGNTSEVIYQYLKSTGLSANNGIYTFQNDISKEIQITNISIGNHRGQLESKIPISETFTIDVNFSVNQLSKQVVFSVIFYTNDGDLLLLSSDSDRTEKMTSYEIGNYSTSVVVPAFMLNVGSYCFDVTFHRPYVEYIDNKQSIPFEILDINNPKSKIFKGNSLGKIATILNYSTLKKS